MDDAVQPNVMVFKQEYAWHAMDDCLRYLRLNKVCMADEKFRELLRAMERYVDEKTALPKGAEITDMYVVLEVETVDNR